MTYLKILHRLALCRNVLIVQQLLILSQKKLQLSPVDAETIRSEFLPRTVPLTHAYYALSWLCHYPAQTMSNSLIEQNIRQMAVLGFKKPQDTSGINLFPIQLRFCLEVNQFRSHQTKISLLIFSNLVTQNIDYGTITEL